MDRGPGRNADLRMVSTRAASRAICVTESSAVTVPADCASRMRLTSMEKSCSDGGRSSDPCRLPACGGTAIGTRGGGGGGGGRTVAARTVRPLAKLGGVAASDGGALDAVDTLDALDALDALDTLDTLDLDAADVATDAPDIAPEVALDAAPDAAPDVALDVALDTPGVPSREAAMEEGMLLVCG